MVDSVASSEPRCKCCLNENGLRDMWAGYISSDTGEFEIFGQMLTDCYNLPWDPPEDESPQEQICDSCVDRLRIAYNFKKEILETNELLTEVGKHATIKTESAMDSIDEGSLAGEDNETMQTEEPEYYDEEWLAENLHLNMKHEPDTEQYEEVEYLEEDASNIGSSVASDDQKYESDRPKKKKKKNSRRYKPYTEVEMQKALTAIQNKTLTITKASNLYDIPQNTLRQRIGTDEKGATDDGQNRLRRKLARENIMKILQNCNGTPIRAHWGIGYECSYCPQQFRVATELNTHTLTCHDPHKEKPFEIHPKNHTESILKLDITSLSCNLCRSELNTIKDLINHLNSHGLEVSENVESIILPFKFSDSDTVTCAICGAEYKYFIMLVRHMKTHFKNYECPYCGLSFVVSKILKVHMKTHETGVFKCEYCGKDQRSRIRLVDHIRIVHVKKNKTHVCGYCPEKFISKARQIDHEVKVHGLARPTFECKECGQSFNYQYILSAHIRKDHLDTQARVCQECGKLFKTSSNLNKHIKVKHREHKGYTCHVCSKTFSTKYNMDTHLRIHMNDLRFTCEHCEMAFVQKYTLKLHIKRKHGFVNS